MAVKCALVSRRASNKRRRRNPSCMRVDMCLQWRAKGRCSDSQRICRDSSESCAVSMCKGSSRACVCVGMPFCNEWSLCTELSPGPWSRASAACVLRHAQLITAVRSLTRTALTQDTDVGPLRGELLCDTALCREGRGVRGLLSLRAGGISGGGWVVEERVCCPRCRRNPRAELLGCARVGCRTVVVASGGSGTGSIVAAIDSITHRRRTSSAPVALLRRLHRAGCTAAAPRSCTAQLHRAAPCSCLDGFVAAKPWFVATNWRFVGTYPARRRS